DLGEHEHVNCRKHLHEVLETITRARVAVRLESQHHAPLGKGATRRLNRGGHLHGGMAVVVDQRERPAVLEPDVAHARETPARARANRGPTPLHAATAPRTAASLPPSGEPTATAAVAFKTLCRPGRFRRTVSGVAPSRFTVKCIAVPSALASTARHWASAEKP